MPVTVSYKSQDFLKNDGSYIVDTLKQIHKESFNEAPSNSQITAWKNSISILKHSLKEISESQVTILYLLFEYELPRERGRRPDVLLFYADLVFVLEFKDHGIIKQAFIDQVSAYAKDLKAYHAGSRDLEFAPILVITKQVELFAVSDTVTIVSPDRLTQYLMNKVAEHVSKIAEFDIEGWLNADYSPLPSLIDAATKIFRNESLPAIRRAQSAGIPETINRLRQIALEAENNKEHHLALITGVPGAGKTLVGLTFVYDTFSGDGTKPSIFLSGNGPLVEVLQYALKSRIFVQDVHGFLRRYGGSSRFTPEESIIIFDEAQRAWDAQKVSESSRAHSKSEPEDFLSIGEKKPWCLLVGLIGEGQEIHIGEESGIQQWNDAIAKSNTQWKVSCPKKLEEYFTAPQRRDIHKELNLTHSLRSHLAEDVQRWVNGLLDADYQTASRLSTLIEHAGFAIYITQHLEDAKNYVKDRYEFETDKRFGLIASAKDRTLPAFGVQNDFVNTRAVKKGPWYVDPPESRHSCCQLEDVVTEFGCQGLELDMPIVCWGDDFTYSNNRWIANRITRGAKDNFNLRKNSYRVLLSRGRDGMVIFVPPVPILNETFNLLIKCGALKLEATTNLVKTA